MLDTREKPIIWTGKDSCPLCGAEFETENVWMNRLKFTEVYTDRGKHYQGTNPLWYEIWVCPKCLYASYRKESFDNISDLDRERFDYLTPLRKKVGHGFDFSKRRDFELAVQSFKLALLTLQSRRKVSAARFGMLFMRLAWLFRDHAMIEEEKRYLALALARYVECYEKEQNPEVGAMGELGLVYMIGELYRRTGDVKTAMEYYMKVVMDKELHGDTQFLRYARDQLDNCKEGRSVDVFPS